MCCIDSSIRPAYVVDCAFMNHQPFANQRHVYQIVLINPTTAFVRHSLPLLVQFSRYLFAMLCSAAVVQFVRHCSAEVVQFNRHFFANCLLFSSSCSVQPPFVQQQLFNSTALCSAATCSPLFSSNSFNSAATVFVRQLFVVRHCSAAVVLFSRYCICSPFVQQQQSDHFRSTVMTAANPAQSPPYPLLLSIRPPLLCAQAHPP
jgi:hypothetical protein